MANINILYVPNIFGRTSFPIKHNGTPLFYKKFDGSDIDIVDVDNDTIRIDNHYLKTGEKLEYTLSVDSSSISIDPLSPGALGVTTCFPNTIYPIVVDRNTIRVALAASLALSNSYVDITSVGIGTEHYVEVEKQNTKCLISIDNIVQSPLSVGSTVGIQTVFNASKIRVSSLKNIKPSSVLKINDGLFRLLTLDYELKSSPSGYDITLLESLSYLGTSNTPIDQGDVAYVMEGNYTINKDILYFTSAPFEGRTYSILLLPENFNYSTTGISSYSFNYFTNNFQTGSQVKIFGAKVPNELTSGNNYFIIKNSENNFSFANSYLNATNNEKIEISDSTDVSNVQLIQIIPNEETKFNGRAFLRSNYNGNAVFDDVSEQFNGISSSFTLSISGINTVGIKSDNGVVLVNNIFQYPESEESFIYEEDSVSGITSVTFIGSEGEYDSGIGTTKTYDVNVRGLPRGGIIAGIGLSYGTNYQPLIPAELFISTVLPEQEINPDNIAIGVSGSGYRSDRVYNIHFETSSGIRTTGLATAIIENGSVVGTIFSEIGVYTGGTPPTAVIDPPLGYENISVSGSTSGIGASISLDIDSTGSVKDFRFTNPGYGYTAGEVLTPVGIVTAPGCVPLQITVNEITKDSFAAWNLGILQKLDDFTKYVNGTRKIFTLYETIDGESQPISLEKIDGSEIDLAYNLLIFINDVLQIPNESYTFTSGTKVVFKEAPALGSIIKVYFYKGYYNDTEFIDIIPIIEPGDLLQIRKDLLNKSPQQQQTRTVKRILTSDTVQTELYDKLGLSESSSQFRSISWTPQKQDIIISGEYINKSRYSQRSNVNSIVGIGTTLGTFVGLGTNIIGLSTTVGIGSLIVIGDYVESSYTGFGVTVVSVGSDSIGIGKTYYTSSAPSGISTTSISIWRKS